MAEPVTFPSSTRSAALPLLIAGQAQKEFYLNQAFAIIDALLTGGVEGSYADPPVDAEEGMSYRVTAGATAEWAGHEDAIAIRVGGSWVFVAPWQGMALFDRAADQRMLFSAGWSIPVEPSEPTGGSVVDIEARDALTALIEALRIAGFFPNPT